MFRNIEDITPDTNLFNEGSGDPGWFGMGLSTVSLPNDIFGKITCGFTVYDSMFVFIILMVVAYTRDARIKGEFSPRFVFIGLQLFLCYMEMFNQRIRFNITITIITLLHNCLRFFTGSLMNKPIFIPFRPPNGFRKYAILFETGQSPGGGTSSVIFIRLVGKLTKSPGFSMSWSNEHDDRHLFWSQNKDIFIISVPHYLGYIEQVEIVTDKTGESPPWFLRNIRIMCLDNNKCWKAVVNAWLRGDKKPFTFKTHSIGALSTRDYMAKVFLQNHAWTMMWWRKLGSYFTSMQRCSVLWCSFTIGMYVAHWMTYANPYDKTATISYPGTPVEYLIRGNDSVLAGVLGATIASFLGAILRIIARHMSSCAKWARVDDKDDFGHIMGKNSLVYAEGAVIRTRKPEYTGPKHPYPPCIEDDSVRDILENLTTEQRAALKNMAKCSKQGCGIRHFMNTGECCEDKQIPNDGKEESKITVDEIIEPVVNIEEEATKIVTVDRMPAEKRGFKKDIMDNLLKTQKNDTKAKTVNRKFRGNKTPMESSGADFGRKKRYVKKKNSARNSVPMVSARVDIDSGDFSSISGEMMSATDTSFEDLKHNFDSLSEPESDEDVVTKFTRTDSEINIRRRPANVYDAAPLWDDRNKVYVTSSSRVNHHRIMNKRYAQTSVNDMECCQHKESTGSHGEQAILDYLSEEESISPGSVAGTGNGGATAISGLSWLISILLPAHILYQRIVLPNAHNLYYMYAMVICFIMHSIFFCTVDACICAFMATRARRKRITKAREEGEIVDDDTETTVSA